MALSRFVRFYHLSDDRVLRMPVRRFFAMSRQIPRLQAEETLLLVNAVNAGAFGGDTARPFIEALRSKAGGEQAERPKVQVDFGSIGLGGDD